MRIFFAFVTILNAVYFHTAKRSGISTKGSIPPPFIIQGIIILESKLCGRSAATQQMNSETTQKIHHPLLLAEERVDPLPSKY
jgi:hypothetical protein